MITIMYKRFVKQLLVITSVTLSTLVVAACGASTPATDAAIPVLDHHHSHDYDQPPRILLAASPAGTGTASGNEPGKMQGMVAAHNATRQDVSVTIPMRWSSDMAAYAQEWSNYLAFQNGCKMAHRSTLGFNRKKSGENIYWASPLMWSDGRTEVQDVNAPEVAKAWADEKVDYNYANNSCRPGKQCGHYTQMVWRDSTEVGCGMTLCPDKGQIWVCNYNPPGNWVGEKPY